MCSSDLRLSLDEVRARLGPPSALSAEARSRGTYIDDYFRSFIAHSPFVALASADATGLPDCSPRGDYPGFVKVIDEHTLAIPDRPGNKVADTFGNLAESDGVGLLFLIPGVREVLRVNGRGYPTDEPDVLARMSIEAKVPELAIIVEVEQAYFHCGRALVRSRLWDPASQALAQEVASPGEAVTAQLGLDTAAEVVDERLEAAYQRLY